MGRHYWSSKRSPWPSLANEAAALGAAPDAVMQMMSPWMAVLLGVGAGLMVSACWHLTCGGK